MTIDDVIKQQINELTDFDVSDLTDQTNIEDVGLTSLDYLSIQVAIKRNFDIDINLDAMVDENIQTFGELNNYINGNYMS